MSDRSVSMYKLSIFSSLVLAVILTSNFSLIASQPQWIWTPKKTGVAGVEPQGECYFRKKFTLVKPEQAEMELLAGDEYELYINGRLAARGQSYGSATKMDVSSFLVPGVNLIAAKVRHNDGNHVGLAVRFRVREKGETRWRSLKTDDTWKTRVQAITSWNSTAYNDMGWLNAQSLGKTASADEKKQVSSNSTLQTPPPETNNVAKAPAVAQKVAATKVAATKVSSKLIPQTESSKAPPAPPERTSPTTPAKVATQNPGEKNATARFEIDSEFTVQQIMAEKETGSLIAMEFNEFGKMLLSREGGPLLIADPTKQLNDPNRVRIYCDAVSSCQGILPLNGDVYVTANGPSGQGLYRLTDANRDGKLEVASKIVGFTGKPGEHGPHGIQLGPDGMLYVIIGNGSGVDATPEITSPYQHFYEGDLVPRYEDPGGHAQGVKAPGGTIIRVSLDGKKVETVAGGIRNAFDLVFDKDNEIFLHDSDMESDIGTTWYRPTMAFHVPHGAELGWRSGWSKFPQYFIDQTPAVCETGRGSPTGAVLYQHLQFPVRFQDTIFLADWSEGRILTLRTQPSGAGYAAQTETFLKGRPLNVCDLAVGEDGALYFCTGGRGTQGGVYRVTWNGKIPEKMLEFESDLAKAIRHPQPGSAWARQNIAEIRIGMGDKWATAIQGVAKEKRNTDKFRTRALQLMVLYGPVPSPQFLAELSQDESVEIRAQITRMCGLVKGGENILHEMVTDPSPVVRRAACESFMRIGKEPELASLIPMLQSTDRIESLSARRLIERMPVKNWEDDIFTTDNKRLFIQGSVAMMTADPSLERAYQVLAKSSKLMEGFINDYDFVDLLRTMQLALVRGKVDPARIPGLAVRVGNEFPSESSAINRELARLLAFLKAGDLEGRIEEYVQNEKVSVEDKVHVAMYLQTIGTNLTTSARMAMIDSLEKARQIDGAGGSYQLYLQRSIKELSATINENEVDYVLQNGHLWPSAATAAFYKLPEKLTTETVQTVIEMDQRVQQSGVVDNATNQLRLGVIAVLARSGDETSMEYLRQLWQQEETRRNDISIGLAQQPEGENWAYLVSSIPMLDDLTGMEVLEKLSAVPRRPRAAQHYHDVISVGYRMRAKGTPSAIRLLQHWSGEQLQPESNRWDGTLNTWKNWYHAKFPNEPKIEVDSATDKVGRYSVNQVLTMSETSMVTADTKRGHDLFAKAQCATCHRFNGQGQSVGPDLTNLSQRFSLREVVESTIDPSKVIPDRYASKKILTVDGTLFTGMAIKQADGSFFVLQSDGKKIRIAADDVEEVKDSKLSAMPNGLLDGLSEAEVNDLFGYLMSTQSQNQTANASQSTVNQDR
ncbi:MAG: HEAT repeat domain-containing protein [Mariniblastus sp.]